MVLRDASVRALCESIDRSSFLFSIERLSIGTLINGTVG